ncbi:MAG: thiI, partial [Cohnella sp.]|nr:thiI [Cohnella sp.]
FGELTIKGRNRGRFEDMMVRQVKKALSPFQRLSYKKTYGRLYIGLNGEDYPRIAERLTDVFGLLSFSRVIRCGHELNEIQAVALQVMRQLDPEPRTFKVTVKRAWKAFPHGSQEMNHLVGAHVLRHTPDLKVNVREPDTELKVDIQPEGTYVYAGVVKAAGGFPLGMNGKAMLLLSGGIDSPVAGWMSMRKGLEVEAVHFHSYPFTSEQAQEKVITLAQRLAYYGGSIKLHMVSFTDLQTRLVRTGEENLIITLMRRSMLRIAEKLAEKHGALAIVTGDSLGQVASQTLGSMNVIGRETSLPLLRPLVMMDKLEIIRCAEKIGTFETSILPFEDCCTLFVPKSPATNPNLRKVTRVEAQLGDELDGLIEQAVASTETIILTETGRSDAAASAEERWF